jgi:iron complex outermembrane recepter protein
VLGDPFRDQVIEQTVFGANLSFTPFATWAGDVGIAIGAEYRKEEIRGFVPEEFQPLIVGSTTTNRWSVGNYLPSTGEFDVKEAYLEAVVPLGFGAEFNGAVRATDYSTSGYVTTWRAGLTWQPIDDIRLRVTRSRDIRAPNLNELFAAGTANTDSVSNPFFNAATGTATPLNGVVYNTASIGYSGLATGNLDLDPEIADSWNIGAVVSPRFLPGFSASADYFRVDLDGAIDFLSAQNIINFCFQGRDTCGFITQDPANSTRILIRTQPFNFQRRLVRGIDFEASYRTPVDRWFGCDGNLFFRAIATHYIENIIDTGIAGTPVLDTTGVNGGQLSTPSWIYRVSATYDSEEGSLTAVGRGVSAGRYAANGIECAPGTCPTNRTAAEASAFPTYDDNTVSGAFYVDLNATMKFSTFNDRRGEFFINVTNVFDATPILLPETGMAANTTYSDMLGRTYRVGVRLLLR